MPLSTPGLISTGLVCLILVATLFVQVRPPARRAFVLLDLLGVLPGWKFFIHDRGGHDVAVQCRQRTADGVLTDWRTVWSARRRGPFSWIWQPEMFPDSVIWLAIHTLEQRAASGKACGMETSNAYSFLVALCREEAGAAGPGCADQFALVQTVPDGARSPLFTSTFHTF
jgi:hypothetical protein